MNQKSKDTSGKKKEKKSWEKIDEWFKAHGVKVVEGKSDGVTVVFKPKPQKDEKK